MTFYYIFIYSLNNKNLFDLINSDKLIVRIIKNWGKISFSVYLTHPIIVHLIIKPIIEKLNEINSNQIIWYILLCPVMFVVSYYLAKAFKFYEKIIMNIIRYVFNKSHKN